MIYQHPFYDFDIELAIRECAASIDQTFLERARREDIYDGTTAIGAFFHPRSSQRGDSNSVKVEFPLPSSSGSDGAGDGAGAGDAGGEMEGLLTRQYSMVDPDGMGVQGQQQQSYGHHQLHQQEQGQRQGQGQEQHGVFAGGHSSGTVRQSDTRMTVFNIGDSQAVLCRDGVAICSE
jgi:hypothetical protein